MAWGINDRVTASQRSKGNLCRVDRDVLFLLFEQRIEQKSKLKFHPFRRARLLHHLDFSLRQGVRVLQNPADQRGLAMINMTDENNLQMLYI